jgi:hypothetical protein
VAVASPGAGNTKGQKEKRNECHAGDNLERRFPYHERAIFGVSVWRTVFAAIKKPVRSLALFKWRVWKSNSTISEGHNEDSKEAPT